MKRPKILTKQNVIKDLVENTVVSSIDCWEWQKSLDTSGYGIVYFSTKSYKAHRLSAWVYKGMSLDYKGMVCHKCDVPRCCNPFHLVVADGSWNSKDAFNKGRRNNTGEFHPGAKLGCNEVEEIRYLYNKISITQENLGELYGVSRGHIASILLNRAWSNINIPANKGIKYES